jgi:hypothetical protein
MVIRGAIVLAGQRFRGGKVMRSLKILGIVGFVAAMAGCVPDWARQNETGLIMEIADIGEVTSDVSSFSSDVVSVVVNVYRKNPTVAATSALEHVRVERYEVRFFRSDGANVEGVDVPFRHSGPLNERFHTPTETGEIEITVDVPVVRDQAKREPPLRNLIGLFTDQPNGPLSGAGVITTVAEITVHARQVTTGEGLIASARTRVLFGDFGVVAQ